MQAWTASASNAGALSFFGGGSLLSRVGSDAAYIDEPEEKAIPPLLESRYQEEKIEGLKRTIALITLGKDVSEYFPQVVKNVATPSLEVKKLVYIYLVHYAEKKPDEALLAINSLQKDLSGPDPVVRALALRALTGIRVRVAAPLGVIAVQKCSRDASAYVRRSAAHAVLKLHSLDPVQYGPPMEAVLATLLGDNSPLVVGSAAAALRSVAPEKLGHFARHFPRLCQMLPDLEEWGQIVMLDALLRCAKVRFPPDLSLEKSGVAQEKSVGPEESVLARGESGLESGRGSGEGVGAEEKKGMEEGAARKGLQERGASNNSARIREEGLCFDPKSGQPLDRRRSGAFEAFQFASVDSFYAESSTGQPGGPNAAESTPLPAIVRQGSATVTASLHQPSVPRGADPSDSLPPDLRLLLYCSAPLLTSRNSGVVLAAATLHWHLAPHSELPRVVKPLTFLLRSSPRETQYLALCAISTMARERPSLFGEEFRRFSVKAGDPLFVRALKLDVLATVAQGESVDPILKELQVYSTDADPAFVVLVVRTLGKLARQLPDIEIKCVQGLLSLALTSQMTAGTATAEEGTSEGTTQGAQLPGQEPGESSNRKDEQTGTSGKARANSKATGGGSVPVRPNEAAASSEPEAAHKSKDPDSIPDPRRAGVISQQQEGPPSPHQNDLVVSESISVLCRLVRERPNELEFAALRLVAGLERIRVSDGRAAVVAQLGDLCGQGGVWTRVTPVVLRFMVGRFTGEEDGVKLAVLELASKYWLSLNPDRRPNERPLVHHVFTLARYDNNVDIRDRGRFLRHLLEVSALGFATGGTSTHSEPASTSGSGAEGNGHEEQPKGASFSPDWVRDDQGLIDQVTDGQPLNVSDNQRLDDPVSDNHRSSDVVTNKQRGTKGDNGELLVQKILLRAKPAPRPARIVPDRASFLVGTMSHVVNHAAPGYQALPEFGASLGGFGIESEESTASRAGFDSGKATEATGAPNESSEYSGSYGSSDGETEEGSGSEAASDDLGSTEGSASENDGGTEKGVSRTEGDGQTTGGAVFPQPLEKNRSSEALTKLGTKERTAMGAEQEKKTGEVGQGDDAKPEGNGTGVGVQSSAVQDIVGDLLSTDDLESWLGSLTVSEDHKRSKGPSLL